MMKFLKILAVAVLLSGAFWSRAEEEDISPWDLWRQGYEAFEKGESARNRGDHLKALEHFETAAQSYRRVKKMRPNWNQNVIDSRIVLCEQEIEDAGKLLKKRPLSSTETKGGKTRYLQTESVARRQTGNADAFTSASELVRMQEEITQYKKKLFDAMVELDDLRKQSARGKSASIEMENMLRERRIAAEKYRLLEIRCAELENKAAKPAEALKNANRKLVEMQINLETAEQKLKIANSKELEQMRENTELLRERDAWKNQAEEAEKRLRSAENETNSMRSVRDAAAKEKNAALLKNSELEKSLAEAAAQLQKRNEEIAVMNRRLQDAIRSKGASVELSTEIAAENEVLKKQTAKSLRAAETAAETIRTLQNELRENRMTLEELRAEIQRQSDRKNRAESELKLLQKQIAKNAETQKLAETENTNLLRRNRKLEEDVKNLTEQQERYFRRLKERDTADRNAVDVLTVEKSKLNGQISGLKLRLAESKVEIQSLQKRQEVLTQASSELRAELLKTKASALSLEQELKKMPDLQTERNRLDADLAALKQNFAALQIERQELLKDKKELETLREEAARLRKTVQRTAETEQQNQSLSDRNAQLLRQVQSAEAAANQLRRQRDEALASSAKLQQERDAAESAVTILRQNQLQQENLRKNWQKKFAEMEMALASARRGLSAPAQDSSGNTSQIAREAEQLRLKRIQAEKEAEQLRLKRIQAEKETEQLRLKRIQEAAQAANLELRNQMNRAIQAARTAAGNASAVPSASPQDGHIGLPAAEILTAQQIAQMLAAASKAEKEDAPKVARWNYRKILESEPAHFEANFGMGRLELADEEFQRAAIYLQQAHIAQETRDDVSLAYAQALLGQDKPGNALALLDGCRSDTVKGFPYLVARGRALAETGRTEDARKILLTAVQSAPENGEPLLLLAKLPFAPQDETAKMQAAKWYEKAKKLGVTPDPELEKSLGKLLNERAELMDFMSGAALEAEKHRDWNSAVWYYVQLRDMDPQSGFYAERAARYAFLQKKFTQCLELLNHRPSTPGGEWLRAASLLGVGKVADAQKAVRSLSSVSPDADLQKILPELAKQPDSAEVLQLLTGKKK